MTVAGSVSVSNFPAVQTVGVNNFPVSQAVTGPFLTDTELRAAPVDVQGSVGIVGTPNVGAIQITSPWQVQGGLTDAELRASPVPVSGPLTDAQLRAADVPVSGPLTDDELRASPLDLPDGAADNATLSEVALTAALQREAMEVA